MQMRADGARAQCTASHSQCDTTLLHAQDRTRQVTGLALALPQPGLAAWLLRQSPTPLSVVEVSLNRVLKSRSGSVRAAFCTGRYAGEEDSIPSNRGKMRARRSMGRALAVLPLLMLLFCGGLVAQDDLADYPIKEEQCENFGSVFLRILILFCVVC